MTNLPMQHDACFKIAAYPIDNPLVVHWATRYHAVRVTSVAPYSTFRSDDETLVPEYVYLDGVEIQRPSLNCDMESLFPASMLPLTYWEYVAPTITQAINANHELEEIYMVSRDPSSDKQKQHDYIESYFDLKSRKYPALENIETRVNALLEKHIYP